MSQRLVLLSVAALLLLLGGAWFARDMDPFWGSTITDEPSEPIAIEAPIPAESPVPTAAVTEAPAATAERRSLEAASPTIRFTGRVTDLYEPTKMVAGAKVWTTPVGETVRILRVETDEAGDFAFEAAPEEEATIFIEAVGYAPFRAPVSEQAIRCYRESHGRQVLDGGRRISIGIVELVRGVRVDGQVRFADGRPAVGAELYLFWHGQFHDALLPREELPVGTTGAGGGIELDGRRIPIQTRAGEGNSLLVAIAEGRMGWAPFAALKGREAIEGLEIVIRGGRPLRVRVTDEADRPIRGARVTCERIDGGLVTPFRRDRSRHHSAMPAAVERFFVGETGGDGEILFPQLPMSSRDGVGEVQYPRYDVFAEADGFAGESSQKVLAAAAEGSVAEIHFRLSKPDTQAIAGRVVDTAGGPLAGARVALEPIGLIARSDQRGGWEIELPVDSPPDVELKLIASAEGFVSWARSVHHPPPGAARLEVGDLVLGRPARISGRVVDRTGRGVEGAGIWFMSSREGWRSGYPTTRSGPDGSFVNEHVPEGEWELVVWDVLGVESGSLHLSERVRAAGGTEDVLLVVDLEPRASGRLIAELFDETSGAPLDALFAGVRALDGRPGRLVPQARIAAGRVTAEELEPGRYQLWAETQDHALAMASFDIEAEGAEARLRVPVGRPGSLRGSIVPNEGRDLSTARITAAYFTRNGPMDPVMLHPNLSAQIGRRPVDQTGRFSLEGLTPGRWRIEAAWEGEISERVEVEVVAHQESEVELSLHPAAILVIAFIDCPAGDVAELTLRREDEPPERRGFFLREGLPNEHELALRPGRIEYEVKLSRQEDAGTLTGVVVLKAGEKTRMECEW